MSQTKQRIVDTAERLFNESGTGAVSTNHIAAAMGISPGNLYYHFGNKDEIVVAALERLASDLHAAWSTPAEGAVTGDRLEAGLERTLAALEEHRFLAREIFSLPVRGGLVRERCRELVEAVAVHLGRALEPWRDDHPPDSGATAVRAAWVRSMVPLVLAWGALNELFPPVGEARDAGGARAAARLVRALHRAVTQAAAAGGARDGTGA